MRGRGTVRTRTRVARTRTLTARKRTLAARARTLTARTRTLAARGPWMLDGILPVIAGGGCLAGASGAWRVFDGTNDQVAAARRFVRSACGDHAACDDAVLVASELTANTIAHSRSGRPGGAFGVHLAVLNERFVVVVVTDQGGPTAPRAKDARAGAESGRGLRVVRALAAGVVVTGGREGRSVAALVPAGPRTDTAPPPEPGDGA